MLKKKVILALCSINLLFGLNFQNNHVFASGANETNFQDIKGHWAESYINEAVNRGIVAGISPTKFSPNSPLTYEEFLVMLDKMLTEYNIIESNKTGCNLVVTNYNQEFKETNGDYNKLSEYRKTYLQNNPEVKNKIIINSDKNTTVFNKGGYCSLSSWTNYAYANQNPFDRKTKYSVSDWVKPAIASVPYVVGFMNFNDFYNEENIKDFSYYAYTEDLSKKSVNEYTERYLQKRLNVFSILEERYLSTKNVPLKREDMALILYSFLNYNEQKLTTFNQDKLYYGVYEGPANPFRGQDYNFRTFRSNYVDIDQYYLEGYKIPYYYYSMERVKTKKAVLITSETTYNYEAEYLNPIPLTNRAVILAVSDVGLIQGNGKYFYPKNSLTRAEGLCVILKLEKLLKDRYQFEN